MLVSGEVLINFWSRRNEQKWVETPEIFLDRKLEEIRSHLYNNNILN